MTSTESNLIPARNIFTFKPWHIIVVSLLLFSIGFAIENYSAYAPRYAVVVPSILLLFIITAEVANIDIKRLSANTRCLGIILPFIMLIIGTIIGIYNLDDTFPLYFVGDFYVIAQFIIIGLIFSLKNIQNYADKIFWGYFAAMIITSMAELYFSYTKHLVAANRFIPFDILFVITCAWFAFYHLRFFPFIVLIGLLISYAMSGMRLGFGLSVLMTCFVIFASRNKIYFVNKEVIIGIIIVVILAVAAWLNVSKITSLRTIVRIKGTFQKKDYELVGVNSRFREAKNVISQQMNNPVFNIIFGNGHGALYKGYVAWDLAVNLTDKGTHTIHMTPVTFFFRYGLLGLTWYLLVFFYAILKAKRIILLRKHEVVNDCMAISNLYLCSMLLSSIIGQNNFIYMDIPIMLYLAASYERIERDNFKG